jgi:hypothetical protein
MSSNPAFPLQFRRPINEQIQWFADKFPTQRNREVQMDIREDFHHEQRKLWPIGQSGNSASGILIEEFLSERLRSNRREDDHKDEVCL